MWCNLSLGILTLLFFRNPAAQAVGGASAQIPAASSSQQRRTTISAANAAQASTRPTTTTSQGQQPGFALGNQAAAGNPNYVQQSAPVANEPTRMGTRATTNSATRKKYGE